MTIIYFLGFAASFILFCIKRMEYLHTEFKKVYEDKLNDIYDNNINNILIYKDNVLNTKNNINDLKNEKDKSKFNKNNNGKIINFKEKVSKRNTIDIIPYGHINNNSKKTLKGNYPPKKTVIIKNPIYKKKPKEKIKLFGDIVREYIMKENNGTLSNKELYSNSPHIVHIIDQHEEKKEEKIIRKNTIDEKKEEKAKQEKKIDVNYDDYELNNLDYLEAIEYDNRTFFRIYWSLLKREHLIIFTFFSWNDYNIFSIKLTRFFHAICTDMVLNVFFFSDESMHNVYQSGGAYNFFEQLFQMVISTIVSQLLQIFLNYLTMTDIHYYMIKSLDKNNISKEKVLSIINCIRYKLIIFYIFVFMLFLFYWYVVTAFCAVYENTQRIFITNSLLSFFMGLIYPFAIYLIPTGLRILSLSVKTKKNLNVIYFLSNIIPFF